MSAVEFIRTVLSDGLLLIFALWAIGFLALAAAFTWSIYSIGKDPFDLDLDDKTPPFDWQREPLLGYPKMPPLRPPRELPNVAAKDLQP